MMRTAMPSPPAYRAPAELLLPGLPAALRYSLLAVVGSLILWASAKVQVPFWPVPMTMQPMVVLLIGALYGPGLGVATIALYLAEGAVGLPVFAGTPARGIGIPYMLGPTGGYMVGWLFAAALAGWVVARTRRMLSILLVLTAGMALIYLCGFAWLATHIGPQAAFAKGVVPFVLGDALKIGLATAIILATLRRTTPR
jgi:biotin transport system substrate-specific component